MNVYVWKKLIILAISLAEILTKNVGGIEKGHCVSSLSHAIGREKLEKFEEASTNSNWSKAAFIPAKRETG